MTEKTIYALGFFDGVHLGHQALLKQCKALASEYGCIPGAVTFTGHPDSLVLGAAPKLINTEADRLRLLHAFGAEQIISIPFDRALMQTPWSDFLRQLIAQGAAGFVCGDDFRFGAGGNGTAEKLAAFCQSQGLPCAIVPEQTVDGVRISSTHIRSLIESGDMEAALQFLGHPHVLSGQVVSGRQLGRTLGIPTANVLLPESIAMPKLGVYACKCSVGGKEYLAVTNIGSRPTVGGHQVRAESWLLDFEGDLYSREITLEFYKFLRPEQNFDSLEQLTAEIQKNAAQCRNFFDKK